MKDWNRLRTWANYLDNERDTAMERVEALCTDEDSLPGAIEDIEINYLSLQKHLEEIFKHEWELKDDLSPAENLLDNKPYFDICVRIKHHLALIRGVHNEIYNGCFIPNPMKYFY